MSDFLIRNKNLLPVLIVSQISEMDQIRQYIIPVGKAYSIILERRHIHIHGGPRHHFYDNCPQSVEIHVNQWHDCFIAAGIGPVAFIFSVQHQADNGFGIIYLIPFQRISIIP